ASWKSACHVAMTMGDECRWSTLAECEARDAKLVDLPLNEQVSRGKELLSMLGGFGIGESKESSGSLFPAAEPFRNMTRTTTASTLEPHPLELSPSTRSAASSSNARFLVDAMIPTLPAEMPPPPPLGMRVAHPAAAVSSYPDEWMLAQGHFSS
ncbi:unnamed protein product, partial [Polarella glacialis]